MQTIDKTTVPPRRQTNLPVVKHRSRFALPLRRKIKIEPAEVLHHG
jgi:hypothetical protein